MRVLREAENPKRNFFLKMIKTIHKLLKDVPRAWKGTLNCLQVYFRSLKTKNTPWYEGIKRG